MNLSPTRIQNKIKRNVSTRVLKQIIISANMVQSPQREYKKLGQREAIWILRLRLRLEFKVSLFYYLAHFCYYSWVLLHFLILFIVSLYFSQLLHLFTVFSIKNFQFQLNKLFPNRPLEDLLQLPSKEQSKNFQERLCV